MANTSAKKLPRQETAVYLRHRLEGAASLQHPAPWLSQKMAASGQASIATPRVVAPFRSVLEFRHCKKCQCLWTGELIYVVSWRGSLRLLMWLFNQLSSFIRSSLEYMTLVIKKKQFNSTNKSLRKSGHPRQQRSCQCPAIATWLQSGLPDKCPRLTRVSGRIPSQIWCVTWCNNYGQLGEIPSSPLLILHAYCKSWYSCTQGHAHTLSQVDCGMPFCRMGCVLTRPRMSWLLSNRLLNLVAVLNQTNGSPVYTSQRGKSSDWCWMWPDWGENLRKPFNNCYLLNKS